MSRTLFSILLTCTFTMHAVHAQDTEEHSCSHLKSKHFKNKNLSTLIADPLENDYDIHYLDIDLSATNINIDLSGSSTTHAVVTAIAGMSQYVCELNLGYTIDSIKVDGINRPFTRTANVVYTDLESTLALGTAFTAQVFYRGAAAESGDGYSIGIYSQTSPSWGAPITYTLTEPFAAKGWFPAKQSLTDKIDSARIAITVPDSLKVGSNGLLIDVQPQGGNRATHIWKTKYPIAYYLLSFSVGNYVHYDYKAYLPYSGDSVLMQNFVYANPSTLTYWQSRIDSIGLMMTFLSDLFGDYPFKEEKYGVCMAPFGGGMEHQTLSTQGNYGTVLSAHELGHHWFGDFVTCQTWADIWINEGFASYCEYLYIDEFNGATAGTNKMNTVHNSVMSQPGGTLYCYDSTNETRIFSSRLSYNKGSAIVHALRFEINNDSLFYAMLRGFLAAYQFSAANTEDFKEYSETFTGISLDDFVDQWIYKEGFPTLNLVWNKSADDVIFQLSQTTSVPSSVAFFKTPLEVKFISSAGIDTTVRVYHSTNLELFNFTWPHDITQVIIDPDNWILNQIGIIAKDTTLPLSISDHNARLTITPNPTDYQWTVTGIAAGSTVQLISIDGKTLSTHTSVDNKIVIEARHLPIGTYFLDIWTPDGRKEILKLAKK